MMNDACNPCDDFSEAYFYPIKFEYRNRPYLNEPSYTNTDTVSCLCEDDQHQIRIGNNNV